MARPLKQAIDYFSVDVYFLENRKVRRIKKSCGSVGVECLIFLLSHIYREYGYYIVWDDDSRFDMADMLDISEDEAEQIINEILKARFFNQDVFDSLGILTSSEVLHRFFIATQKRKEIFVLQEIYDLIENRPELPQNAELIVSGVNSPETQAQPSYCPPKPSSAELLPPETDFSSVSGVDNRQSKSKSKVNINTPNGVFAQSDSQSLQADAPQPKQECALTDFVIPLTGESKFFVPRTDYEKWKTLFPGVDIDQELRKMHAWCDANPAQKKTPRGVRAFIVRWLGRAQDSGKGTRGQPAAAKAPSWARGQFDKSKYEKPYQPPDPSLFE